MQSDDSFEKSVQRTKELDDKIEELKSQMNNFFNRGERDMSNKLIFEGLLFPHAETGTEGVIWALQENYKNTGWSYDGLHVIEQGDHLTIYNPSGNTVWEGEVNLIPNPNYEKDGIHEFPKDFPLGNKKWIEIFSQANLVEPDSNDYSGCYTGKLVRDA